MRVNCLVLICAHEHLPKTRYKREGLRHRHGEVCQTNGEGGDGHCSGVSRGDGKSSLKRDQIINIEAPVIQAMAGKAGVCQGCPGRELCLRQGVSVYGCQE